ncbi:VOC family protein [Nitrosospira sp. Nsp1]|uniref:VOC family protein n=1 Tax=Nitrosospira sp. Nsp1 TaxID=136547 RepID=UPI000884597F|nr:VOC family protein [Nitrosospira sp. Nsp1]SCX49148.1 methylmalonyl-CoA epimerase [Nitrosospira sp. Nsp1]
MQAFLLRFHHFGLASRRPEQTLRFLRGLGHEVAMEVYDPLQNVNLWLCTHFSMPTVELVGPAEGQGPLDAILATSNESIYHLCYETENLDASLEAMKAAGFRVICISAPKPAILFNNRQVSFYMIKDFGIIELLEPA